LTFCPEFSLYTLAGKKQVFSFDGFQQGFNFALFLSPTLFAVARSFVPQIDSYYP